MADLGAIGKGIGVVPAINRRTDWWVGVSYKRTELVSYRIRLASYVSSVTTTYAPIPVNGAISGTVVVSGAPVSYCIVRLYWRPTGQLIEQTKADIFGAFSFSDLNPDSNNYYVLAITDDHNAIIFDTITPVAV